MDTACMTEIAILMEVHWEEDKRSVENITETNMIIAIRGRGHNIENAQDLGISKFGNTVKADGTLLVINYLDNASNQLFGQCPQSSPEEE